MLLVNAPVRERLDAIGLAGGGDGIAAVPLEYIEVLPGYILIERIEIGVYHIEPLIDIYEAV